MILLSVPLSIFSITPVGAQSDFSEEIFGVEEELNTEDWERQVENQRQKVPVKPEEFVVSGSKYAQSLREAPATMTVLDRNDIRAYGIATIEELLRIVPGVNVQTITPTNRLLGIRGLYFLTSNTVLVLVDGREVNCNFHGGILWGIFPVTFDDIERIEVIRGPGSALFGANAYSGVVNIITRHPRDTERLLLSSQAGSYQTEFAGTALKAAGSYTSGKLGARLAADYTEARGWYDPGSDRFPTYRTFFRTSYEFDGLRSLDVDGGYVFGDSYTYSWIGKLGLPDTQVFYLNARYSQGPFNIQANGRRMNVGFVMDSPVIPGELLEQYFPKMRGGLFNGEVRAEYSSFIGRRNRITAGLAYLNNYIYSDQLEDSPQIEHRLGFFFQDEFCPLEYLIVYLGARYDWNSAVEDQTMFDTGIKGDLSPRLSLVYLPSFFHSFRISLGRAFRKPNFFESGFRITTLADTPLEDFLSNPDARNEHIDSLEFGYRGIVTRRIEIGASGFFNQYRDTVIFQAQYMEDIDFTRQNFGFTNQDGLFAQSRGGEISIDVMLPADLRAFANFSVLTVHVREDAAAEIEGLYPRDSVSTGFRWLPPRGPTFSLLLHWTGSFRDEIIDPTGNILTLIADPQEIEQPLGEYFFLHLQASYRFWSNRLETGVRIWNLLGDSTRQYPGVFYQEQGEQETNYGGEEPALAITGFFRASF